MESTILTELLHRDEQSHKYDYGHVLVIGGSPGMVGAPLLSGLAALRSGAGLVTVASKPEVIDKLEGRIPELMTYRIQAADKFEAIADFIANRKVSVVAVGLGWPTEQDELVQRLLGECTRPMIIDGGGLAVLQRQSDLLNQHKQLVLTPHVGEFQRFFKDTLPKSRDGLKTIAQNFVDQYQVTLILKGNPTFVAHPNEKLYINTTGGPALATAGTGDVLTGIIAGLMAQGIKPFPAAQAAVFLHGWAGDIAAQTKSVIGVIASDVIEAIPHCFATMKDNQQRG